MNKEKDYEPIKLEIFQSDLEKIMYQMERVIEGYIDVVEWKKIKSSFEHKIEIHKRRGEWLE